MSKQITTQMKGKNCKPLSTIECEKGLELWTQNGGKNCEKVVYGSLVVRSMRALPLYRRILAFANSRSTRNAKFQNRGGNCVEALFIKLAKIFNSIQKITLIYHLLDTGVYFQKCKLIDHFCTFYAKRVNKKM